MSSLSASTYAPTFLEKLLGGWYKWWFLGLFTIRRSFVYIWNEILTSGYRFIQIFTVIVLAYQTADADNLITYIVTGSIYFALIESFVSWELGESIQNGKMIRFLLLPSGFFQTYAVIGLFRCLYLFISYLPGFVLIGFFLPDAILLDLNKLLPLLIFLPISWFLRLIIEMISASLAFWTIDFSGGVYFGYNLLLILSGSLFPLDYLHPYLYSAVGLTPFPFTFYHPMQIYLGNYDNVQTGWTLLGGVIWCVILYFLAKLIFKLGLKRNESVGL